MKNDYFSLLYHINDEFMIEFSKNPSASSDFKTMVDLYRYYSKSVNVPRVLIYDQSRKIVPFVYAIFRKPAGKPLCSIWNSLEKSTRSSILHQTFGEIKKINQHSPSVLHKPKFVVNFSKRKSSIHKLTSRCLKSNLSQGTKTKIKNFVREYLPLLREETLVPTYNLFKFDFVFVKEDKVTGLTGFNHLIVTSNDYILESLFRMASDFLQSPFSRCYTDPKRKIGFDNLLEIVEDELPEIFQYREFDKRLGLYLLERSMRHYLKSKDHGSIRQEIDDILEVFG